MTYPSSTYQRSWTYDTEGNDFNAKLGRLLCKGQDLKASMRASELASVGHMVELERQHGDRSRTPPVNPAFYHQASGSGRGSLVASPEQNYVMADSKGRPVERLNPSRTGRRMLPGSSNDDATQELPNEPSSKDPMALTKSQAFYQSMRPAERTCHTWRRINPGCMEYTTPMPTTSMKDHYQYDEAKAEPMDFRHHAKKTDFSDYTEAKVIMNRLTT